jgi:ribosomal protein L21
MYVVFETGGKQYKASEGDVLFVEKLDVTADETITFDNVKIVSNDGNITVGTPTVDGASVSAKVLKNGKAKKVIVYKMKPKDNYRKKQGHRQPYTKIQIEKINA